MTWSEKQGAQIQASGAVMQVAEAERVYSIEDWDNLDDMDFRGIILEEIK